MRAVALTGGSLAVTELPDPEPGPGQVLVRTIACGICGSDLHAKEHFAEFAEFTSRGGGAGRLSADRPLVFGHEFSAELVGFGPDTVRELAVGTTVCSLPYVFGPDGPELVGYSHTYPGGFGELMVLQEALLRPVPEGVDPVAAALTEPLAVGEHAVGLADVGGRSVCLVLGCGPVGLAVVSALKARGVGPVVAADFSPTRRRLAEQLGADVVVDPAAEAPHDRWDDFQVPRSGLDRGMLEALGVPQPDPVVFECVGVPGMLQSVIDGVPARARVVVVGVCMEPDRIEPAIAITKELELRFAFGYTDPEFTGTLHRIAEGRIDTGALVTSVVGPEGVADAFVALKRPDEQVKVLVRHDR